MKLTANKNYFDIGDEGRFQRCTGETFEISTDSATNRARIFEAIAGGLCYPSEYPEIVEVTIKRYYNIFERKTGQWHTGNVGETRDVPRDVALQLVCSNIARPTSGALWFYDPPEVPAEDKIRILHEQGERAATAEAEKKSDNFVQRWGKRWKS